MPGLLSQLSAAVPIDKPGVGLNGDLDGRVVSATLGPDNITYGDLSQVFSYDNLNRLVSATLAAGQTRGYSYDANGNRTTAVVNASTTTYNYPGTSHKLTSLTGGTSRSFTYDNAGNTTASAGITYVYDGRGRMKQAGSTTYLVNGLGQRVKKGAPDTYFAYDEAGHLVGEYDSTGALIQELVWLGDTPVASIRPGNPTGYVFYYIWTDLLDTPRMITDVSNQARWTWTHDEPFGNSAPNENPASLGAFAFNLRFPGQYYDAETGLHYNYFRDYDPRIGRYIESDPIGLAGGLNSFAYVMGNPIPVSDSEGLSPETNPDIQRLVAQLGPAALAVWKQMGGSAFNAGDQLEILRKMLQTQAEIDARGAAERAFVRQCVVAGGRFATGVLGLLLVPGNIGQSNDPCKMGELCRPLPQPTPPSP
jgi:RHS repeat-associated protein